MIRRTNTASGTYLLRRAMTLASGIRQKFGRRTEVHDGYLVEGRRANEQRYATVIEPPGTLVGFGAPLSVDPSVYGGVPIAQVAQINYGAPERAFFSPSIEPAAAREVMPAGQVVRQDYTDEAATVHRFGAAPPAGAELRRFVQGRPWEGEAGVYCCFHLTSMAGWPLASDDPMWLQINYQPAGLGDGRKGAILSAAYIESLAPGYRLFFGSSNGGSVSNYAAWPNSHGCEDGTRVVVTFQVQQLREPGRGAPSHVAAQLCLCIDLLAGELVWSRLFEFDQASHPLFRLEVVPYTSPTSDLTQSEAWPDLSMDNPVIERVVDEEGAARFSVAFRVRCYRPYLFDMDQSNGNAYYFGRWFTAVCVLAFTPESVTDEYYAVDCWCGSTSPAIAAAGADGLIGVLPQSAVDLLQGRPIFWAWVYDRPELDEFDPNFYRNTYPSHVAEYQRLYFGSAVRLVAADAVLCGLQLTSDVSRPAGTSGVNPIQFRTKVQEDALATVWYRATSERRLVVAIIRQEGITLFEPLAGVDRSFTRSSVMSVTCPQRQVLDAQGEVVTPFVLVVHTSGGIGEGGADVPVLAIKRGMTGAWARYPAKGYAQLGVAYTGNPLVQAKYGRLFEGGA